MKKNNIAPLFLLFASCGGNEVTYSDSSEEISLGPAAVSVEATRGGGRYGGRKSRVRTREMIDEFEEIQVENSMVRGETHVHFGNLFEFDPKGSAKVGEVDSRAIYMNIPAYQTVRKEKLKKGSARRAQLMAEATQVHSRIVLKVAQGEGYSLVIEMGKAEELPRLPSDYPRNDLTDSCIRAIGQ